MRYFGGADLRGRAIFLRIAGITATFRGCDTFYPRNFIFSRPFVKNSTFKTSSSFSSKSLINNDSSAKRFITIYKKEDNSDKITDKLTSLEVGLENFSQDTIDKLNVKRFWACSRIL